MSCRESVDLASSWCRESWSFFHAEANAASNWSGLNICFLQIGISNSWKYFWMTWKIWRVDQCRYERLSTANSKMEVRLSLECFANSSVMNLKSCEIWNWLWRLSWEEGNTLAKDSNSTSAGPLDQRQLN